MDATSVASTISDSLKTSSSSVTGGDPNEDSQDLIEDKAVSPVDLECFIQTERITKLLDGAVYKTKLALCLPQLMREKRTLASIMDPQDLEEVEFIFEQHANPLFSTSLINIAAMEELENGDTSLRNRVNPELAHLVCILNSYKQLKPRVEAIINKVKTEYYNTMIVRKRNIPVGFEYLLQLEQFRDLMVVQMETTAAKELQTKIKVKQLEASNAKLLGKIADYGNKLKSEKEKFESDLAKKIELKNKLQFGLTQQKQFADYALKQKTLDTDRQMVMMSRSHGVRNDMQKEEAVEIRDTYERVLGKDILDEKNVRARRCKVETQLLSWVQKYDAEMTEKQIELDDMTKQYDDEADMVQELEKKLEEQDKEFEPLMKEREDEYQAEMTDKMELFTVEHAARVIQMAWRQTLANRNEKIKLRKLQKKQQQEAAQAARAAQNAAKREAAEDKKAAAEAKKEADAEKKAADAEKKAADAEKKAADAEKKAKEKKEAGKAAKDEDEEED